jgi:hypothetical protein
MRRLMGWALAPMLVAALAGCASTGGSTPCESCDYGYVPVKKSMERQVWCYVDGKKVDCKKNPAECPACAKHMQERK